MALQYRVPAISINCPYVHLIDFRAIVELLSLKLYNVETQFFTVFTCFIVLTHETLHRHPEPLRLDFASNYVQ